jgi:hypothetical protein
MRPRWSVSRLKQSWQWLFEMVISLERVCFQITEKRSQNSADRASSGPPNYVLGGSENHAESTPPFQQTTLQHRAGFSKAIAVQGSLTTFSQV